MISIKKAKPGDLKGISEILRIEANKKPYFQKWTKKASLKEINILFKNMDIYIAVTENKIVGFIAASLDHKKEVYIDELWLNSKYQRKGTGKSIMEFIEKKYKEKGAKTIKLTANSKAGAIHFYKKLNYKKDQGHIRLTKKLK